MRALLSCLLSMALSFPVLAQPKTGKSATEEAAKHFNEGEAHFKLGDYDKALDSYKKAYVLTQEPLLLFNIGQCYRNMKMYQKALDSYQLLLTEAPNTPQRALVEAQMKEVREEMAKAPAVVPPTSKKIEDKQPTTPRETRFTAKQFYLTSATTGGLTLLTAGFAATQALKASRIQDDPDADPADIQAPFDRARSASFIADGLLVATAAFGIAGVIRAKKQPKTEITLTPSQVHVAFQF